MNDQNKTSGAMNQSADNVLGLVIGLVQLALVFSAGWLEKTLGLPWFIALGIILTFTIAGFFFIQRLAKDDKTGILTLLGLSVVAVGLLFWFRFGIDEQAVSSESRNAIYKLVVAEIYIDKNQNGKLDGIADVTLPGVEVTVRGLFGRHQESLSNAKGVVQFEIPEKENTIQVVVCGVAQSHIFSPNEQVFQPPQHGGISVPKPDVYKIEIGIELSDVELKRCKGINI